MILCATHYEGDPTDNTKNFYEFLNKETYWPINFAVFGLGNTGYKHYNAMGKFLNKKLEELGGKRWYDYGEGNDAIDLDGDFEDWSKNIPEKYQELCKNFDQFLK